MSTPEQDMNNNEAGRSSQPPNDTTQEGGDRPSTTPSSMVPNGMQGASREPPVLYTVHNTVRGRHNRTQRANAPAHHRFRQHISIGASQVRLVRGRPLQLTEENLHKGLKDIRAKAAAGIVQLRGPDGRLVDPETLRPIGPPRSIPPQPRPRLDSIANDTPAGVVMEQYPTDAVDLDSGQPRLPSLVKAAPADAPSEDGRSSDPGRSEGETKEKHADVSMDMGNDTTLEAHLDAHVEDHSEDAGKKGKGKKK